MARSEKHKSGPSMTSVILSVSKCCKKLKNVDHLRVNNNARNIATMQEKRYPEVKKNRQVSDDTCCMRHFTISGENVVSNRNMLVIPEKTDPPGYDRFARKEQFSQTKVCQAMAHLYV